MLGPYLEKSSDQQPERKKVIASSKHSAWMLGVESALSLEEHSGRESRLQREPVLESVIPLGYSLGPHLWESSDRETGRRQATAAARNLGYLLGLISALNWRILPGRSSGPTLQPERDSGMQ